MKFSLLFVILFAVTVNSFSQTENTEETQITIISGTVKGERDSLLEGVNVVIKGTIDGATTDNKGYYEFETEKSGQQNLLFSFTEYADKTIPIEITPGKNLSQNVKLTKEEVRTEEIIVTASSFTSGQNNAVALTSLEIARIPGADADLYRAITTFPGKFPFSLSCF